MVVQCAWCGIVIAGKKRLENIDPLKAEPVSHGICRQCLSDQLEILKLRRQSDAVLKEAPVLDT